MVADIAVRIEDLPHERQRNDLRSVGVSTKKHSYTCTLETNPSNRVEDSYVSREVDSRSETIYDSLHPMRKPTPSVKK